MEASKGLKTLLKKALDEAAVFEEPVSGLLLKLKESEVSGGNAVSCGFSKLR